METTIVLRTVKMTSVYCATDRGHQHGEKMASFISGLKKSKKHQVLKEVTGKVTVIDNASRQLQLSHGQLTMSLYK